MTYRVEFAARKTFPDPAKYLPRYKLAGPLKGFKILRRAVQ